MLRGAFEGPMASWRELCSREANLLAETNPDLRQTGVRIGDGVFMGVVTKRDTHCELRAPANRGGKAAGSARSNLAILFEDLCDNDESPRSTIRAQDKTFGWTTMGKQLPCAMAIVVSGNELEAEDYERLLDALRAPSYVEGCMIQASAGSVSFRVSKRAVKKGVSLNRLASAFTILVHDAVPRARKVEVALSSDVALVDRICDIAEEARNAGYQLRKRLYAEKGVDLDCASSLGHCGSCKDKDACASVRKIERMRGKRVSDQAS